MSSWLKKFISPKSGGDGPKIYPEDSLEAFFTNFEKVRGLFRCLINASNLAKRILLIHGVGGVGKTSLLRIFRLDCRRQRIPVALVSGDKVKTSVHILRSFSESLQTFDIRLRTFEQTLNRYKGIQAKVEHSAANLGTTTAEAGLKTIAKIGGGAIPGGIGKVVAVAGEAGAGAFIDWLRGLLPEKDLDLYLDPEAELTKGFLRDLAFVSEKSRIVLMIDTYEQVAGLDQWVRSLSKRLSSANVLIVIAGRIKLSKEWDQEWPGWMAHAQIEELEPMEEEDMRLLIARYCRAILSRVPEPTQIDEIIQFSRGLPLAVTTAVRLWRYYGVLDFNNVKAEVVADLVDQLLEGTNPDLRSILEAAAVLRWFDKELLRMLLTENQVESCYEELRQFPFVQAYGGKLTLHDVVRDILDAKMETHDLEKHRRFHRKAATYFESCLAGADWDEQQRLTLELLYHRFKFDENDGIRLFREICEELARDNLFNHWRAVLNEIERYDLKNENSQLWRDYYSVYFKGRTFIGEGRLADVKPAYEAIVYDTKAEPLLQAYALCDLGWIATLFSQLGRAGALEDAIRMLKRSLSLAPLDSHLVNALYGLARACWFQGEWEEATIHLEEAKEFFVQQKDAHGLINVYLRMREQAGHMGDWRKFVYMYDSIETVLSTMPDLPFIRAQLGFWSWIWSLAGRYKETERYTRSNYSPHWACQSPICGIDKQTPIV
jgi:tetratricopeptide (TPR) repeat protein